MAGPQVRPARSQGADPAAQDAELRSALHHAVLRGHTAVADALLAAGGAALLFAKDMLGFTPVHLAAMQGQMQNQVRRMRASAGGPQLHAFAFGCLKCCRGRGVCRSIAAVPPTHGPGHFKECSPSQLRAAITQQWLRGPLNAGDAMPKLPFHACAESKASATLPLIHTYGVRPKRAPKCTAACS